MRQRIRMTVCKQLYEVASLSRCGQMRVCRVICGRYDREILSPLGRYNRSDGVEPPRFSGACVTPRLQQRNIGARETGGIKSRNTKPCRFQCISVLNKKLFALPRYSSWPRIMPPTFVGSEFRSPTARQLFSNSRFIDEMPSMPLSRKSSSPQENLRGTILSIWTK